MNNTWSAFQLDEIAGDIMPAQIEIHVVFAVDFLEAHGQKYLAGRSITSRRGKVDPDTAH